MTSIAAFVLQQGQELPNYVLEYLIVGLVGVLIASLTWYFNRLERKFDKLEVNIFAMRAERKQEIEDAANAVEMHIIDLKADIKKQLDELSRDVKNDIGEMSKVKQRLVAIEVKLGIPVHVNGDPT
jgi:hypothetical protein